MAAACALDVLAGGGELEDPRLWSTRGAAEPASALAASLARPLPLRACGALPTWGYMIHDYKRLKNTSKDGSHTPFWTPRRRFLFAGGATDPDFEFFFDRFPIVLRLCVHQGARSSLRNLFWTD